jgi:hypothetical protein
MAALNLSALLDALATDALKTGQLERFRLHEPKNAPGNGLSGSVYLQAIRPARSSGLAVTSALVTFTVRIYSPMLAEPQDDIDINLCNAVDALFTAYTGAFTLGGLVQEVDLLGINGTPLSAQAGYLTIGQTMYRTMDIFLSLVVDDVYPQAA